MKKITCKELAELCHDIIKHCGYDTKGESDDFGFQLRIKFAFGGVILVIFILHDNEHDCWVPNFEVHSIIEIDNNDEIESRINRIVAIARLAEKLKKILSDTQIEIRDENQINNFIGCEWEFEHGSEYYA